MLKLKNALIAAVIGCVLLTAIGGPTPSSAQSAKPVQDVSVVNAPTVQAQQAGPWTVGAQLAPGSTVGISGTPTVSISGTPTVVPAVATALHLAVLTPAAGSTEADSPQSTINASLITITSMKGNGNLHIGYGSQLMAFILEPGRDLVLPLTQPFAVNRLQVSCFPNALNAGCQAVVNVVGTPAQ